LREIHLFKLIFMKNLLTFVLLLSVYFCSFGQTHPYIRTVKEGRLWEVIESGMGNTVFYRYRTYCDTLINSHVYYTVVNNVTNQLYGFVREDVAAERVYYIKINSPDEYLIVDYKAQVGDSLWARHVSNSTKFPVDSVYSVFYLGMLRKAIRLNTGGLSHTYFYEGIGDMSYGVATNAVPTYATPSVAVWDNQIRCPQSMGLEDKILEQEIQISPNPATNTIQIVDMSTSHKDFKVEVYDIMGKVVKHFEFRDMQDLDISDLVNGMYLFDIQSENSHKSVKIVKID